MNDLTEIEKQIFLELPFLKTARPDQKPPPPEINWRNWLFMGGRGAGKTRAGAEWVRCSVLFGGVRRIALVGATLGDVREVMIEGPSGLRAIEADEAWRPVYSVSRRRLEWANGAVGLVFSAEDPDSLRGPQFDAAWCDEIAAWPNGEAVWDTMQMGLRLGESPHCVATTTPRAVGLVKRLVAGEASVTHATTEANAAFLSQGLMTHLRAVYGDTVLARQELGGELIEDTAGALWTRSIIDRSRVAEAPPKFEDIIVAVNPPATSGPQSDACGIIGAGVTAAPGFGQRCFVLADGSVQGLRPLDWAARVVAIALDIGASRIIAEANQGGEMVRTVLVSAGCRLPIVLKHARLGKSARAMPVAALYQTGKVSHVGAFAALEDEMCQFGCDGLTHSPDRVDALVWAVSSLVGLSSSAPRLRQL